MGGDGRVENGGVCNCMRINEHVLIKSYKRDGVIWRFGEIERLLYDRHQKGKMMIMIMKTSGS